MFVEKSKEELNLSVTKMVLSNELDPDKALLNILNSERYKEVTLK